MSPAVNGDVNGMYYSTPELNTWGKTQAVTRELDGYNCCVTGFDIRPFGDRKADYDFNDVMVKVTATPEKAIRPGEDIPVDEDVTVAESIHGTLAFEDQWPNPGDYDLNDFVVNYTYGVYKNVDNKINGIQMRFRPIAKGAASYTKIGFGIELPLASNDIDVAEVDPRTSADEAAWRYPKEKSSVVKAYKNYNKWVTNKTDLSWFDSTIPGNVDGSELY